MPRVGRAHGTDGRLPLHGARRRLVWSGARRGAACARNTTTSYAGRAAGAGRGGVEGIADEEGEIFVSFNNNNRDYPVRNALMMKRLLGQPTADEPSAGPRDLFA